MNNFSNDVMSIIFEFLSVKDMLKVSTCCKAWRSILYKYRKYTFEPGYFFWRQLKYHGPKINLKWVNKVKFTFSDTLDKFEEYDDDLLVFFRHCEHIYINTATNKALRNLCGTFNNSDPKYNFIKKTSNIRHLEINNCESIDSTGWRYLNNLKSLKIGHVNNLTMDDIAYFSKLETLNIMISDFYKEIETIKLVKSEWLSLLPNLKSFALQKRIAIIGDGLKYLTNCKNFKIWSAIDHKELQYLLNAEHLDFRFEGSENLTSLEYFTNCKYLRINAAEKLTNGTFCYLQNCIELDLHYIPLLTNEAFIPLRELNKLKKIAISNCKNLTDNALKILSFVEHIDLFDGYENFTDDGILSLENLKTASFMSKNITPKCLPALKNCTNISLLRCDKLYPGLRKFKKQYPLINIEIKQ